MDVQEQAFLKELEKFLTELRDLSVRKKLKMSHASVTESPSTKTYGGKWTVASEQAFYEISLTRTERGTPNNEG